MPTLGSPRTHPGSFGDSLGLALGRLGRWSLAGCAAACLGWALVTPAPAAPTTAAAAGGPGAVARAADEARVAVAPHRAAYRLSLHSARNGSRVSDVRGGMTFEWADACEGWTTEQRFELRFTYVEGETMDMTTSYATWEAKDGSAYRFSVRRLVNGDVDEEIRGDARLATADHAGTVTYSRPEAREEALPGGTLFPSAHTVALLEKAAAGEKFFSRVIFDGTDDNGPVQVSAVIASPRAFDEDGEARSPLLADRRVWPVRLAFFPTNSASPQPDYEMTIDLLRNGVARSMRIDYGDFVVDAVLDKVEALSAPGC